MTEHISAHSLRVGVEILILRLLHIYGVRLQLQGSMDGRDLLGTCPFTVATCRILATRFVPVIVKSDRTATVFGTRSNTCVCFYIIRADTILASAVAMSSEGFGK